MPRALIRHAARLAAVCLFVLVMAAPRLGQAGERVGLDYAYYNPISLVLRDKHWVEEALGPDVSVQWVLSAGSNKALEYLRARSIDFGSTAGSAALLGRANGTPIQAIALYSEPEWTALVTRADSPIAKVADLKGKRVAATPGTDPAIFLLRALDEAGLTPSDITLVPLQHQDGRLALDRADVDAWAGLDPFMAQAEHDSHDRLFYRNPAMNTPGTLLVREAFAAAHPDLVGKVLAAYERGRAWAAAHPDELAQILARDAKLSDDVARLQLGRTSLTNGAIGRPQRDSIVAAAKVLKTSGSVGPDADLDRAAAELIDTRFTDRPANPR